MKRAIEKQSFTIKPRYLENTGHELDLQKYYPVIRHNAIKEIILIESYTGKRLTGHLLILPLFSKSKPSEKQAVLFSNLTYANHIEAKKIIAEGLMCAWEMGYHVAFTQNLESIIVKSGFIHPEKSHLKLNSVQSQLHYYELSWDGMHKIPDDLIFPITTINYSNN
jgi:hypothetical protein